VLVHLQPAYADLGGRGAFPEAEEAAGQVLSLLVYAELSSQAAAEVAAAVKKAASRKARAVGLVRWPNWLLRWSVRVSMHSQERIHTRGHTCRRSARIAEMQHELVGGLCVGIERQVAQGCRRRDSRDLVHYG
jgi:hypothetical protein